MPRLRLAGQALLAAAALLGACSSMAPSYERPAAPVAPQFPGPATPSASGAAAADALDWQAFFADARLKRLIALALQNNRDLRIAALNIEQVRAAAAARDADRWPTVNAGLAASRQPNGRGGINSLYTAGVSVTAYEADLFGRLRSLSDAAAAQVLASVEARKAVQISLVGALANAHLALVADDELLRVTQESLATREASLKLIRLRFDNGASSAIDLRQAESLLEAARVAHLQATRQRALDENALVLLLGQALPADLPAGLPLAQSAGMPELPVGLPSEVLVRRPDVRQAEQQLIAANANIGAARAAFFPRITLTGSLGSASTELSGLFKSGSFAWSFAPQLLQPIFDAGRNRANLRGAEVGRDIAVAQYERAVQSAFREVADALAGRATLAEQLQAQQRLTEAEASRAALADLRYRNGAASFLEVLDAQRSLLATQQALVQVRAQVAQNLAALYRTLGGGWQPEGGATASR
ncbi:MAG: efflux transporter outer membrane subunit [Rubrivivax sp.]|nr:efflux transporter outer membrane subunit [Rubrivivax sp.]